MCISRWWFCEGNWSGRLRSHSISPNRSRKSRGRSPGGRGGDGGDESGGRRSLSLGGNMVGDSRGGDAGNENAAVTASQLGKKPPLTLDIKYVQRVSEALIKNMKRFIQEDYLTVVNDVRQNVPRNDMILVVIGANDSERVGEAKGREDVESEATSAPHGGFGGINESDDIGFDVNEVFETAHDVGFGKGHADRLDTQPEEGGEEPAKVALLFNMAWFALVNAGVDVEEWIAQLPNMTKFLRTKFISSLSSEFVQNTGGNFELEVKTIGEVQQVYIR
ncbi:hypothetical protein C2S52_014516 [Perilla frutescens var. hirtella]|nr:hypothetical protein C2S52_014516 [Perilla frutescens var. hirtella]